MKFKTLLLAIVAVLLFAGNPSDMQAQKRVKNYIKNISANPIALAFNKFTVTYEQQIGPKNSFSVYGIYNSYADWTGFGVGGSWRWYLMPNQDMPIKGFSAGPIAELVIWSFDTDTYESSPSLAIGGEVSYKWVLDKSFSIEPIVQVSFNLLEVEGLDYSPVLIGVNLGYAW